MCLNTGGDGDEERDQQGEASTSGVGTDRDAFRDAVSIQLCIQALQSSCLLPFLDRQLGSASFNDMASRQAHCHLQHFECYCHHHGQNMLVVVRI